MGKRTRQIREFDSRIVHELFKYLLWDTFPDILDIAYTPDILQ